MIGYIGIDPGMTGAAALLAIDKDGERKWHIRKLNGPALGDPILEEVTDPLEWEGLTTGAVAVEKVSASPVMKQSDAFKFGRSYQWCLDNFQPTHNPTPQVWQSFWEPELKDLKGSKRKSKLWHIAKRHVPSVPKYAADAVLIAIWLESVSKLPIQQS